jgi:5-formyltetrahydrofolate cyclo-ligase
MPPPLTQSPSKDGRLSTPDALSPEAGRRGDKAKALLRAELRAARNGHPENERRAAADKLAETAPAFLNALRLKNPALAPLAPSNTPIALYAALPGELDCFPLLEKLAAENFPTLLPVAGEKATPLKFRLWRPGEKLVAGRHGLREPDSAALAQTPKIILAPLLGFDSGGGRLGFGGGYYDATLAHLRDAGAVLAGGLAFSFQKIDKIPLEPHDVKLDFVITEEGLLDFRSDP